MINSEQTHSRMVSKIAVEALRKADVLKDKFLVTQGVFQNVETWANQQELLKIYRDALIYDLEYALDKKVEQDLWNYGFKNYIVALQNMARDKKDNWGLFQTRLAWFLDSASGFYLTLLQEICSLFGLDLQFKRHKILFGFTQLNENAVINRPERSSCYYICQHCLVHLGDIARYRNQMSQAESFYRHAAALGANSGHPYNQLALLEASRADRLSTVFYYTRSIAVAHKFPAALTNLSNTLSKCANTGTVFDGKSKLTASDYEAAFLRLHAILYLSQDIPSATSVLQSMTHSLTPLIATQEFSSWKLVQMAVISIFTYTQIEEKKTEVRAVLSKFLIDFMNALLLPLYTISSEDVSDYFSLLATKVLMSWLKCEPGLVEALNRPHLWRGLCRLLNILRKSQAIAPMSCINAALPEDYDLRGFLPLEPALSNLNFGGENLSSDLIKILRAFRIIKLGEWLALYSELKPIFIDDNGQFDASCVVPALPVEQQQLTSAHQQSANPPEILKGRSRQNVALQSILRRSQCQSSEINLDTGWQPNKLPPDSRWWPQGNPGDGGLPWTVNNVDPANAGQSMSFQEGTYSLFSGSSEMPPPTSNLPGIANAGNPILSHQSLWSGPGPSPLERLLEQQKQLRHSSQFNT